MTGFRVALGGAQELYGMRARPDVPRQDHRRRPAGRRLRRPAPTSWSTSRRSGRSTRPARSRATRSRWRPASPRSTLLAQPGVYATLERARRAARGRAGARLADAGVAVRVNRVGSMFTLFFTRRARDATTTTREEVRHRALRALLPRRCSSAASTSPPSQFEAAFVSLAHGADEIDETVAAARDALAR